MAPSGVSLFAGGVILKARKPTISKAIAISIVARLVVPGIALLLLPLMGLSGSPIRESWSRSQCHAP